MASALQIPHLILEYHWLKEANRMLRQGLVSWTNGDPSTATWESLEDLHRRFPEAPAWVPEQVLESRWSTHKTKPRRQVQVAWNYSTPGKATWEDLEAMKCKFPATARGQAESPGGGIVSSSTTDQGPPKVRRSTRRPIPSSKVYGPDWVGPATTQQRNLGPGTVPT
jgi:hypothetical protein